MKEVKTDVKSAKVSITNEKSIQIPEKKMITTEGVKRKSGLQSETSPNIDECSDSGIQIVNICTSDFQCKICLSNFQDFEELAEHVEKKHYNS